MEYVSVAEARNMSGLRLALSAGTPGPWSISARAMFDIKKVPYAPVLQVVMDPNMELVEWTGRRNAPVAVYNDEPAEDGWLEITNMAERLGSGPSLFPDDPLDRALAVGLSAELCGHGGFAWSRRLTMTSSGPALQAGKAAGRQSMMAQYGARPGAGDGAEDRCIGILKAFAAQLHRQHDAGRDYLVGDRLSLADVHWACFSQLVGALGPKDFTMPDQMRAIYSSVSDRLAAALDPILMEHRMRIFREYIGLPMEC
ncbi:MAG: glutathione binding-like protein [Novosphingobium sp.]|nr:glutathione binding-like protein [Novosphingobium sp.]